MVRHIFIAAVALTLLATPTAWASDSDAPNIHVTAGFSSQSRSVQAKGEYNMEDSSTLRDRGCVGYVASSPSVIIEYDANDDDGAVIVSAESAAGVVLLIGTSSNQWFCSDSAGEPTVELPAGSGAFSVWVGTRKKSTAPAVLTIQERRESASGGPCGSPNATVPDSIAAEDWAQFSCMPEAKAGTRWSQCYPRDAYTQNTSEGCPGVQLCCPQDGFVLKASQQQAAEEAAAQDTEEPVSEEDVKNSPYAKFTVPPIGTVAEGAPNLVTIKATPYGTPGDKTIVRWHGFSKAKIPVHSKTVENSDVLYHLQGDDFPQTADDSLLVIHKARTLRAQKDTTLSTDGQPLTIAAGQSIELLGRIGQDQCIVRVDKKQRTTDCPTTSDFQGVGSAFIGWSPLQFEWWIAVEDEDHQRGWMHVDLTRPEFIVTFSSPTQTSTDGDK